MFGALILGWTTPAQAVQICRGDDQIPKTTPTSQFTINNNGTVTDTKIHLMWKRCSEGQQSINNTCTGTASPMNWKAALEAAANSTFAGYSDWRLPNIKELRSIVEQQCVDPAINLTLFPNMPSHSFWSASPYDDASDNVWGISFHRGDSSYGYRGHNEHVLLVRSVQ